MPCLSSWKNKFQWTQKNFWPLIWKILTRTFVDHKCSLSKKSTPIQPQGVIGDPFFTMYFQKKQFLGFPLPFLQRSLEIRLIHVKNLKTSAKNGLQGQQSNTSKFTCCFGGMMRNVSILSFSRTSSLSLPLPSSTSNLPPNSRRVAFVMWTRLKPEKRS